MVSTILYSSFFHISTHLVILAPYGINGMLVGCVNREIDQPAIRDNWERNYPIRHLDGLPDFVEVTIGRVDMNPKMNLYLFNS